MYKVVKYLTPEQKQARLNPPKECPIRQEKMALLKVIARHIDAPLNLRELTKRLPKHAALCFYDNIEHCFTQEVCWLEAERCYEARRSPFASPYRIRLINE